MDTWAAEAVRELEVELKRLDLAMEAKRTALERAQADYDSVLAELATVRRMLDWATKKLPVPATEDMPTTSAGIQPSTSPTDSPDRPAQTDLAIHALRQLGGQSSTVQIREVLEEAGYKYDQTQIRSALKYLAKKRNPPVEATGGGTWRLLEEIDYVPNEPESVPAMNGAKGMAMR
jgi:multidrug resistance efflux pump